MNSFAKNVDYPAVRLSMLINKRLIINLIIDSNHEDHYNSQC